MVVGTVFKLVFASEVEQIHTKNRVVESFSFHSELLFSFFLILILL